MKIIKITKIIIERVERIEVEPATGYEEEVGFSNRYITVTDEKGDIYEIVLEAISKNNLEVAGKLAGDWQTPKVYKGTEAPEKAF